MLCNGLFIVILSLSLSMLAMDKKEMNPTHGLKAVILTQSCDWDPVSGTRENDLSVEASAKSEFCHSSPYCKPEFSGDKINWPIKCHMNDLQHEISQHQIKYGAYQAIGWLSTLSALSALNGSNALKFYMHCAGGCIFSIYSNMQKQQMNKKRKLMTDLRTKYGNNKMLTTSIKLEAAGLK